MRRARANALAEYVVIGGVLLVAMLAVTGFSGELNGWFLGLRDNMLGNVTASANASKVSSQVAQAAMIQNAAGQSAQAGDPAAQTPPSGSFSVPSGTANIKEVLQTAGANGTTSLLLANIESAVPKLLADGKITPDQANQLSQLAKLGHQMAAIEKLLEDAAANCQGCTGTTYRNLQINYNGNNYTPLQLAQELQLDGSSGNLIPVNSGSLIDQFTTLQDKAIKTISDPAAQQFLGGLSNQIALIADATDGSVDDMGSLGNTPANFNSYVADVATNESIGNGLPDTAPVVQISDSNTGSQVTKADSTTICKASGSGATNGNACAGAAP